MPTGVSSTAGIPRESAKVEPAATDCCDWLLPPFISVVIPVRNEAAYIGRCLASLAQTDYPHERLEILVVDGESDDATLEIVGRFQAEGLPLRVLENPRRQRCAALNCGIAAARGDVILRVDARNVVPPDYISRCLHRLVASGASNVGGVMQPLADTPTQEAIGLAMSHPFGVGNAEFRLGRGCGEVHSVYLGCFPRTVFECVGLFDEAAVIISEDSDLNCRIRKSGGKVWFDPAIQIYYQPRETFGALWRLYFRYGGARAGTILKHGRPTSLRQLVPPGFLCGLAGLACLGELHTAFLVAFAGVVGLYVACDMIVAAHLGRTGARAGLVPRLLVAFPCMHVAYGLGFLWRLLQRSRQGTYWGF